MNKIIVRQSNIELFRFLSILGIVLMHMMNHGDILTFAQKGNANYYIGWSLFSIGMYSINNLLLISGYFMVKQRFRSWRMYKIASQVLFYAATIAAIFWIFTDVEKSIKDMIFCLLPITSDFYWYPSMYMGMLLLMPVLNKLIHSISEKQLKYVCILCFLLVSVWPNLAFFSSTLNTAGGVSISWFLSVYLFGAYIRLYYEPDGNWKPKLLISLGIIVLLPVTKFFFEWAVTKPWGNNSLFNDMLWGYSVFFQYSSIIVTAGSIMMFLTILNLRIDNALAERIINTAAGSSFGVYLIHDHMYIRDIMWEKMSIYKMVDKWYLLPGSLLLTVLIYTVCMLIELQRKRLFGLWERKEWFKEIFSRIDSRFYSMWEE